VRAADGVLGLAPPAIVYPALTVLFSIVLWAIGFNL
jgi:hypothetical protein